MENKLLNLTNDKELKITSVDLVDIINQFRELESNKTDKKYVELKHNDLLSKIRKEIEVLDSLGLIGERNISQSLYIDSQNKKQPCYLLNRDGMLQMLNSESALVRYKTIEYINKLEDKLKFVSAQKEINDLEDKLLESKKVISDFEKITEEARQMYKSSHKRKLQYDRLIKSVTSDKEEYDTVKEWIFAVLEIEKWEDCSIDQNKKILEIISTVSRMLNIKKFEQLSMF